MLTIRDAFRLLFPDASRELSSFAQSPILPADIFAFAAYVLEASGAYHHVVPDTGEQGAERQIVVDKKLRARAVSIGRDWCRGGAPAGSLPKVPQHVQELWRQLAPYSREPIFQPLAPLADVPRWWWTMLELLMVADEASRDLGFDPQNVFYQPIAEAFTEGDVLSGREFRRIQRAPATVSTADPSVLCVQPKSRTPSVGCTMRSLSHHLALLPGQGAVRARWVMSPFGASDRHPDGLGLLLVPFPYQINPESFIGVGDHDGKWGWFDVDQTWLPKSTETERRRAFVEFIRNLIQKARVSDKQIDGVILPELSLDFPLFRQLARALADEKVDFLIAGLSSDREGRTGNFVAIAPFFLFGPSEDTSGSGLEKSFLIREKHHRWKITKPQIEAYSIESALSVANNWWEHLNILGRSLDLFVYRGGTSLTTLICEDLARVDPCQAVLRSVGPNLVVALLMDGPQLEGRWPARYATVLAEDPGSSVLTFTSLGLIERQNASKVFPQSSSVALWKDEANGVRRLELSRDADAIYLALKADQKTEHTLDGRSDDAYSHRWVYEDHSGVAADRESKPSWLLNAPSG